jgi:signal transduction histidine kinase
LALLWAVLQQPYLGFVLSNDNDRSRVVISRLDPQPHDGGLKPGMEIVQITGSDGQSIKVLLKHVPHTRAITKQYFKSKKAFFDEKARLYAVLSQRDLQIDLADGQRMSYLANSKRPLSNLPLQFWSILFLGLSSWLIGLLVWVWRPEKKETRYLMLSGLGLFVCTLHSAIYTIAMPIMHPYLVWGLSTLFAFGQFAFLSFAASSLVYFPQHLPQATKWSQTILFGTATLIAYVFLNKWDISLPLSQQTLYVSDSELFITIVPFYLLSLYLSYRQWQLSQHKPVERARAQWVLLSWLLGPAIYMAFYALPNLLGYDPLINRAWAWFSIVAVYWMLLVGIARFRLFQLEHHVITASIWLAITLFFIGLDLILIYMVNLSHQTSLSLVIILIIWIYLPSRQWLQYLLGKKKNNQQNAILNDAIIELSSNYDHDNKDIGRSWKRLLQKVFKPISVGMLDRQNKSLVTNYGQGLQVASNRFCPALLLEYADKGERLFNQEDIALCKTLEIILLRSMDFHQAIFAGEAQERERIRRDLHDQIGHKLLSLIYAAKDDEARLLAQETMEQLKTLIRALKPEPVAFIRLTAEIRSLAEDVCRHTGLTLDWQDAINDPDIEISANNYLNILNICRELLNNTIRHAQAKKVSLTLSQQPNQIIISLTDDGIGFNPKLVMLGNGLVNIQSRVQELKGTLTWNSKIETTAILHIPISLDKEQS